MPESSLRAGERARARNVLPCSGLNHFCERGHDEYQSTHGILYIGHGHVKLFWHHEYHHPHFAALAKNHSSHPSRTCIKILLTIDDFLPTFPHFPMKVDLFCADARLAIELDGAQHLADANAYRRDRRKDALLQQNGYVVLRFLS